ncbi:hypothetical protein VE02_07850 [Pseudogymnoascus sp. 03VT05]|nr:hypothetical protein VE02_07850 [Pseudogymnoascus sp. 03VT05]
MPRLMTATTVIGPSGTSRRYSSTYATRLFMLRPFDCDGCDRSFNSEEALQQHLQDSPAHASSFNCETCDRHYGSETALQQHLRDSPTHQQDTETPLDVFFRSFPVFDNDPSLSPATSYAKLQRHEGWRRGDAASEDAWDRYQGALENELHMWYG